MSTTNQRILIVDDEPAVRRLAARMISSIGYETLEADTGMQAIELFEQQPDDIDLIITDFNMPQMSGTELIDKVRQQKANIKVIYVSGFDRDTVSGPEERPNELFIQKPYTRESLSDNISQLLSSPV